MKQVLNLDRERLAWVDTAKGIGVILVVLGHISNLPEVVRLWIYSFHMPLFYMLSGYFYRERNVIQLLKKTVKSLLMPYIIYSVAAIGIDWLLFHDTTALMDAVKDFLMGQGGYTLLWFFPSVFIIQNMYNLLVKVSHGDRKKIVLLTVAVVLVGYVVNLFVKVSFYKLAAVMAAIGFYAAGHLLHDSIKRMTCLKKIHQGFGAVFFIALGCALMLLTRQIGIAVLDINMLEYGCIITTYGIALANCLGVILGSYLMQRLMVGRILAYIGKYSLYFYPLTGYIPIRMIDFVELLLGYPMGTAEKMVSKVFGFAIAYACTVLAQIVGKRCGINQHET